ncbi:MAG: hypothetical protein IJ736_11895 [Firmicutes bacterium]|nr:hypothetical protein [Bacillota bacterium]
MKKTYEKAEIKIVEFASEDITSANLASQGYGSLLSSNGFLEDNSTTNILNY